MDIKGERIKNGLTQFDLAKRIGVSVYTVQLWERGISTPKEENFIKLFEFFDELEANNGREKNVCKDNN
jgi:transcriptional regulator with XRE-family HTH domain